MELVGIIQVPLSAFTYDPLIGRALDPLHVNRLRRVFRRTRCRPDLAGNHAEGLVEQDTLAEIMSKLRMSLSDLRGTVHAKGGSYPQVQLRRAILCLDGKHRVAAASKEFGLEYLWTVQLYWARTGFRHLAVNHITRKFGHQTQYSDGVIYRYLREEQNAQRLRAAQEWRVQLSPCKEKILRQLQDRPLVGPNKESITDVLDTLLRYPGLWEKGFHLANWHRHLALHWDGPIIHFLRDHLRSTYDHIVSGVPGAEQYVDEKTVRCLALRCPQNKTDAIFIRKEMDLGKIFSGVSDPASRARILRNIFSIEKIIPSLATFDENMKYFAIGAKIIRQHLLSEEGESADQYWTLSQLLLPEHGLEDRERFWALADELSAEVDPVMPAWHHLSKKMKWKEPPRLTIEASNETFISMQSIDHGLALKALFLLAIRSFPYLSNDRPKQDVRGEAMETGGKNGQVGIDAGVVYLFRLGARRLGFSSPKIDDGLAGKQPVCRGMFDVPNRHIDFNWKSGRPRLRAFLHLQEHAFLPRLGKASGRDGPVPLFVLRDFLDAFFGPDPFIDDKPMGGTSDPWSGLEAPIQPCSDNANATPIEGSRAGIGPEGHLSPTAAQEPHPTESSAIDADMSDTEPPPRDKRTYGRNTGHSGRFGRGRKVTAVSSRKSGTRRSASPERGLNERRQARRSPIRLPRQQSGVSNSAVSPTQKPLPSMPIGLPPLAVVPTMPERSRSPVAVPDMEPQTPAQVGDQQSYLTDPGRSAVGDEWNMPVNRTPIPATPQRSPVGALNEARRSLVAPPNADRQASVRNPLSRRPGKQSELQKPSTRYFKPSTGAGSSARATKASDSKVRKKRKPASKSIPVNQTFQPALQPEIAFAISEAHTVFESVPTPAQPAMPAATAVNERKRDAEQMDVLPRLRDYVAGTANADGPPRKRARPLPILIPSVETGASSEPLVKPVQETPVASSPKFSSAANRTISTVGMGIQRSPAAEPIQEALAASSSQQSSTANRAASTLGIQRSPVVAPTSSVTSPNPRGTYRLSYSSDAETDGASTGTVETQAQSISANPTEETSRRQDQVEATFTQEPIESFAETRRESPGTVEVELFREWQARSPVAGPDSDSMSEQ